MSVEIDALLRGRLAKAAADRPPDMAHVIAALDRAIAGADGDGSSPLALPR